MFTTRRSLVGAAAFGALAPSALRAQQKPYRIGVLTDMSGPFRTDAGPNTVAATRQAVQDAQAAGLNVEVIVADHQNKPDLAVSLTRQWFDQGGVDCVMDCVGSAVALAVMGVAAEKDKLAIITGAGAAEITGARCNANTIHYAYDTWMLGNCTANAVMRQGGDSWFFITADYAFGHALEGAATQFITAAGGRVVGSARHPFPGTTDFSSQLVAAQASGAKVLGIANAGNDTSNTIKQAAEFGLARRGMRIVGLVMVITNVHALGLEATQGLYFTETFYWDLNPRTRALSARLAPKVDGARLTMLQAGSYGGTVHLLKALQAMPGADRASGRAVAAKMKAMPTDDDAFGAGSIRVDGRKIHPAYLLQVKAPSESHGPWDYCKVAATTPADQAFRPLNAGGCPLVHA